MFQTIWQWQYDPWSGQYVLVPVRRFVPVATFFPTFLPLGLTTNVHVAQVNTAGAGTDMVPWTRAMR